MDKILVVSWNVPDHTTNAGDWRTIALCRALARRHRVSLLVLNASWQGNGCVRELREAGVEVVFPGHRGCVDAVEYVRGNGFGTVIFEQFYTVAPLARALPFVKKVVIDTHEVRFVKLERMRRLGRQAVDVAAVKRLELAMYRLADTLIAISAPEKKLLQELFPRKKVVEIPTCIDTAVEYRGGFEDRRDLVFFGMFGGPGDAVNPNNDAAAFFSAEVLPLLAKELPGVACHCLGAGSEHLRLPGIRSGERAGDIPATLGRFRVFVCPLRYGAGMKKKLLDAAIAGTPVVTTPVGSEGYPFRHGREILVARTARQFARSVAALYRDERLWQGLSRKAYAMARDRYSMERMEAAVDRCFGGEE